MESGMSAQFVSINGWEQWLRFGLIVLVTVYICYLEIKKSDLEDKLEDKVKNLRSKNGS